MPVPYRPFFETLLANGQALPYTVLTPAYQGFIHRSTEKLVCDLGPEIDILEKNGNSFTQQSYPITDITYIEVRTALLDSCIKLAGLTRHGSYKSSILLFNTVTDYLFKPIVSKIRLGVGPSGQAAPKTEPKKFDPWAHSHYKFMSYAKRSLLGCERVIQAILQPELRAKKLAVPGWTYYRTIFPAHAAILTDRELILIREDEKPTGKDRYGGIWDYIPLSKITSLSLAEKGDRQLELSIQLAENARLDMPFAAVAKQEILQLLEQFEVLAKH